jgi:hypothetical protein
MASAGRQRSTETWAQLVRRAHVVATHLRYYGQPADAREVVERVLAGQPALALVRYRPLLQEVVESFMRGLR